MSHSYKKWLIKPGDFHQLKEINIISRTMDNWKKYVYIDLYKSESTSKDKGCESWQSPLRGKECHRIPQTGVI